MYGTDTPPVASNLIGVSALAFPEQIVEITFRAVIDVRPPLKNVCLKNRRCQSAPAALQQTSSPMPRTSSYKTRLPATCI